MPQKRTESPQGYPHDVRVAGFSWDSETDPPIRSGINRLTGEVPAGSIVFGGFLQISADLVNDAGDWELAFKIGDFDVVVLDTADLTVGWHPLQRGQLWDVTKSFPVSLDAWSHLFLVAQSDVGLDVRGQLCLYLLYVNNETGLKGQADPPTVPPPPIDVDELLLDNGVAFFLLDDGVGHILLGA